MWIFWGSCCGLSSQVLSCCHRIIYFAFTFSGDSSRSWSVTFAAHGQKNIFFAWYVAQPALTHLFKGEMEGDSGSDIDSEDEEETVSTSLCASAPQLCNCMLFSRVRDREAKLIYYLLYLWCWNYLCLEIIYDLICLSLGIFSLVIWQVSFSSMKELEMMRKYPLNYSLCICTFIFLCQPL